MNCSGSGPDGSSPTIVQALGVEDLDDVVVAERDIDEFAVAGDFDAARPLPGLDGCDRLHLVGVDHGDRIALLVGNIGEEGESGTGERETRASERPSTAIQRKSNMWRSPRCRVRLTDPNIKSGSRLEIRGRYDARSRSRQSSGFEAAGRIRHFLALHGKWSTLTGAPKVTENRAEMLASAAITGAVPTGWPDECCDAVEPQRCLNIALEA